MTPTREVPKVIDCPECLGTGVDARVICWKCGGFGEIENPHPVPVILEPDIIEDSAVTAEIARDGQDWLGEPFMPDSGKCR